MASDKSKREIPGGLKVILEQDVKLSKEFVEFVNKKYPITAYRSHLKSLEVRILLNKYLDCNASQCNALKLLGGWRYNRHYDLRYPVMAFHGCLSPPPGFILLGVPFSSTFCSPSSWISPWSPSSRPSPGVAAPATMLTTSTPRSSWWTSSASPRATPPGP